jgi:hypothetical protein
MKMKRLFMEKPGKSTYLGKCLLLLALVMFLPLNSALGVNTPLDEFSTPVSPLQKVSLQGPIPPNGSYDSNGSAAAGVWGGFRFIDLTITAMSGGLNGVAVITVDTVNRYSLSIPDLTSGAGNIIWSGSTDPAQCNLGYNLAALDTFYLFVLGVDHDVTLMLKAWDSTCTTFTTAAVPILKDVTGLKAIPFSSFTNPAILKGTVGRVELSIPTTYALDMSFDFVEADCVATPPGVAFSANPTQITPPQCSQLCWTLTGTVTSASIDQGIGAIDFSPGQHCKEVCPTGPITYTLTAKNGCAQKTAIAQINPLSKVPNLNQWGAMVLSLVLAGAAVWLLRRKRTSIG